MDDAILSCKQGGLYFAGYLSIPQEIHQENLQEAARVELYFLKTQAGRFLGLKPTEGGAGLVVRKNPRSRSRYVSLKGFLAKYAVDVNASKRFPAKYDQKHEVVVVSLNDPLSGGFQEAEELPVNGNDGELSRQSPITGVSVSITDQAILKVVPAQPLAKIQAV